GERASGEQWNAQRFEVGRADILITHDLAIALRHGSISLDLKRHGHPPAVEGKCASPGDTADSGHRSDLILNSLEKAAPRDGGRVCATQSGVLKWDGHDHRQYV